MKILAHDFKYLRATAALINDELRDLAQEGRFISPENYKPVEIDPKANSAYFFHNYAEILLGKHYLEQNGYISQIALDEWSEDYTGVIFTDYKYED